MYNIYNYEYIMSTSKPTIKEKTIFYAFVAASIY